MQPKRALTPILAIALLLFAFGFVAQQVAEGRSLPFDRSVILALRDPPIPANPGARHGFRSWRGT